jgi:hypothetical protein
MIDEVHFDLEHGANKQSGSFQTTAGNITSHTKSDTETFWLKATLKLSIITPGTPFSIII